MVMVPKFPKISKASATAKTWQQPPRRELAAASATVMQSKHTRYPGSLSSLESAQLRTRILPLLIALSRVSLVGLEACQSR